MFFNFSYPTVCFEVEKNLKKGIKVWKLYHLTNLAIIISLCILVYIFSDYILSYFHVATKDKQSLIVLLRLAILVPILLVISQALRQLMFALNLSSVYTRIIYFSCILSIVLLSTFVYLFGLKGSFIAMILVELIVISLYSFVLSKKRHLPT